MLYLGQPEHTPHQCFRVPTVGFLARVALWSAGSYYAVFFSSQQFASEPSGWQQKFQQQQSKPGEEAHFGARKTCAAIELPLNDLCAQGSGSFGSTRATEAITCSAVLLSGTMHRHGQSVWNIDNRFTGWYDIELSPDGEKEAAAAGKLIKASNLKFDRAYTSLTRHRGSVSRLRCQGVTELRSPAYNALLLYMHYTTAASSAAYPYQLPEARYQNVLARSRAD
eukprot:17916-Heterococcus_DN1.PRE.1